MDANRSLSVQKFLDAAGWSGAVRTELAGDASTRRYERIKRDGRSAILMDAPPKAESLPCPPDADIAQRTQMGWNASSRLAASRVEAFVALSDYLRQAGLSTPEIYHVSLADGLALIEDLGVNLYPTAISNGADENELYEAAVETLAYVHALTPPPMLSYPGGSWPLLVHDQLALEVNVDLFVEWLPKRLSDMKLDDQAQDEWRFERDALIRRAVAFPKAFTIRDYHAENLLWLPDRHRQKRVGLLDFQDAIFGSRAWDLSVLLHDARRDVHPDVQTSSWATYVARTGIDRPQFEEEFAVIGTLNCLRILGLFGRLSIRDKKERYAAFIPRMWRHLDHVSRHDSVAPMRRLIEKVAGPYLPQ